MKFKSELILQRITGNNLELFDLEFIANEFQYQNLRFDTLAFDKKTNSFVIIEYKNKLDFEVLNQCKTYYNLLLKNKDVYVDKYNEVFGTVLKEDDFEFNETKVLIIGPKFNGKQIKASQSPHYPFEIWKVSIDKNCCISYENMKTHEIKKLQVNCKDLTLREEELLKDKSDKLLELYNTIKNRVLNDFSAVDERILVDAFSFRINNTLICKFIFLKEYLKVYFYTDDITDTEGRLEDISNKNYEGNTYYRFKLSSKEDVDYFFELFKQIYEDQYE